MKPSLPQATIAPSLRNSWPLVCFAVVFMLLWSMFTLFFDIMLANDLYHQCASFSYAETEGKVIRCRVKIAGKGEAERSRVDIEYAYKVDDVLYRGDHICAGDLTFDGAVAAFVADHPPGSSLAVYYDSVHPETAVLIWGVTNGSLFLMLFLLPFNAVLIFAPIGVVSSIVRPFLSQPALLRWQTGVRVLERGNETRIRLPCFYPFWSAWIASLVVPSVLTVSIAVLTLDNPPLPLTASALIFSIGSAVAVYAVFALRISSGMTDLVIDKSSRTIALPQTYGRETRIDLFQQDFVAIRVIAKEKTNKARDKITYYSVITDWRKGTGALQQDTLLVVRELPYAEEVAALLRETIGLDTAES